LRDESNEYGAFRHFLFGSDSAVEPMLLTL
jgi:hypothetical protein